MKNESNINMFYLITSIWRPLPNIFVYFLVMILHTTICIGDELRLLLRPACNQYCDDINAIVIFYTNNMRSHYFEHIKYFEEGVQNVVKEKGFEEKIKVSSAGRSSVKQWNPFITNRIRLDFSINYQGMKDKTVEIQLGMITPSGVYHDSFYCQETGEDQDSNNCIKVELDNFIEEWIKEFVFEKSILNTTYTG